MTQKVSHWATSMGLLQDLKTGDDAGWRQFVHLYTPLIYSWCRKAGLQEADSADICQDVFRSVSTGIERLQYDRPEHSFRGWLWTITRRKIIQQYTRNGNAPIGVGGSGAIARISQIPDWIDDEETPIAESAESEMLRRAAVIIRDDFEEHTWQAFWMLAVDELPTSEIAMRLGMTPGGVRQAKFRVLARLREFIGDI